jgi:hypothetical protein
VIAAALLAGSAAMYGVGWLIGSLAWRATQRKEN